MVVYVEYVFLDNFIIDLMLITLARKSFKLEVKKWALASAFLGATFAVVSPIFHLQTAVSVALKMPMGFAIVVCSGKFRNFKELVKCFYLFLFFTFAFGGVVTAIFWSAGLSFDPINYAHGSEIPMFGILLIIFFCYSLIQKVVDAIYKKRSLSNFIVKCSIVDKNMNFDFLGFIDSGNSLCYKQTGSPIILCAQNVAEKLKRQTSLLDRACDVITVSTISGKSILPIYKIEKFLIYNDGKANILYNVMLGVVKGGFSSDKEYDLLLSPLLFGV